MVLHGGSLINYFARVDCGEVGEVIVENMKCTFQL